MLAAAKLFKNSSTHEHMKSSSWCASALHVLIFPKILRMRSRLCTCWVVWERSTKGHIYLAKKGSQPGDPGGGSGGFCPSEFYTMKMYLLGSILVSMSFRCFCVKQRKSMHLFGHVKSLGFLDGTACPIVNSEQKELNVLGIKKRESL